LKSKTTNGQASVLKRIIAFLIDLIILNIIVLFPFGSILGEIIDQASSFTDTLDLLSSSSSFQLSMIIGAISLVTVLYFAIFEKKLGQTPGKMFFKLYVIGEKKEVKYWQLLARSMFLIPYFPFILLLFIDPIVMFFNKDGQRLSEILSKTKTVEKLIYQIPK
jgi:uncharacterized RDD family membrane protein YckC